MSFYKKLIICSHKFACQHQWANSNLLKLKIKYNIKSLNMGMKLQFIHIVLNINRI
jgi:hypothetical protein